MKSSLLDLQRRAGNAASYQSTKHSEDYDERNTRSRRTAPSTLMGRVTNLEESTRRIHLDLRVCLGFSLLFGILLITGLILNNQNDDFDGAIALDVGNSLNITANEGQKLIFSVAIPANTLVAFFVAQADFGDESADTTMSLIRPPSDIVAFNDDLSTDNLNPFIFFQGGRRQESLFLEVNTLENTQDITIVSQIVNATIVPEVTFSDFVKSDAVLFALIEGLEQGITYEILAFEDLSLNNLNPYRTVDFDTAIRIRELNGDELIEVFHGTTFELTGRLLFTAPSNGPFILESKGFDGDILFLSILIRRPTILPINLNDTDIGKVERDLHTQVATILEIQLEENFAYDFSFQLEQEEDIEPEAVYFGYTYKDAFDGDKYFRMFSESTTPGVTIRLYDPSINDIIARGRTELDFDKRQTIFREDDDDGFTNLTFVFEEDSAVQTRLQFDSFKKRTVLLDMIRFFPDYDFDGVEGIRENGDFGSFTFSFTKTPITPLDENLVDENNLFPDCDIDQNKHIIDDDVCERGIVLYCRDQFFELADTTTATKREFSAICDCATFLCATLPSGDDLGDGLNRFLNVCNGFFAMFSIFGMILYVAAHVDLLIFGGLKFWVYNDMGFLTFTLCFMFLLVSSIFFITQIVLSNEILDMTRIADVFGFDEIPLVSDEETYVYYYELRSAVVGEEYAFRFFNRSQEINEGKLFLNEDARRAAADAKDFDNLRGEIILNLVCSVLKDALAVIIFLDVSVIWISSTRKVALNKIRQAKREKYFRIIIRFIEISYFSTLLIFAIVLVDRNGSSYNIIPNILTLLASFGVILIYSFGRQRINTRFADSTENKVEKLTKVITQVSAVIMVSNFGVVIVQLYNVFKVQDFDSLLIAANDPIAQILFLFRDICLFIGLCAIYLYLFRHFLHFRDSLYVYEGDDLALKSAAVSTNIIYKKRITPKAKLPSENESTNIETNPGIYSEFQH